MAYEVRDFEPFGPQHNKGCNSEFFNYTLARAIILIDEMMVPACTRPTYPLPLSQKVMTHFFNVLYKKKWLWPL